MASAGQDDELALPLEAQRERAVELLSRNFAHDHLTLDELERRIERAYHARSAAELNDLTRDLAEEPAQLPARRSAPLPEAFASGHDRIVSIMTETRRRGAWRPARHLDVWSVMSDTRLDLTDAILSPGVTELHINGLMTAVKVIVPPGVRVVVQADSFMSSVSDEAIEPPQVGSGAPVVRISGFIMMSELKVRVRLRERLPGLPDDGLT